MRAILFSAAIVIVLLFGFWLTATVPVENELGSVVFLLTLVTLVVLGWLGGRDSAKKDV